MIQKLSFWRKVRLAFVYAWRPALFAGAFAIVLYFLLWFRLDSIVAGLSPTEATAQAHLANRDISFTGILSNPLYLPYSLVLYILQTIGLDGVTALRGVSALIGTVAVISFYFIISRWHTPRLALLGTALFATSSWFLHAARYGDTDILYVSIVAVLLAGIWVQQSNRRRATLVFALLASSFYIYIPGMIWFILIVAVWQFKRLYKEIKHVPWWFNTLLGLGGALLLFPLVWSIYNDPGLIKPLLGLPQNIPALREVAVNFLRLPVHIFISGPNTPTVWLPGTPYLDIFSSMMFIIGAYWSVRKFRLDRVRATFGILLLGSLLVALGGPVSSVLLLPFIYIIITAGMTFMLQQWFTVFPRNPIPRTIGASLLSIAVLFTMYYHINHYFIAWPHTPSVRQAFSQKPVINSE